MISLSSVTHNLAPPHDQTIWPSRHPPTSCIGVPRRRMCPLDCQGFLVKSIIANLTSVWVILQHYRTSLTTSKTSVDINLVHCMVLLHSFYWLLSQLGRHPAAACTASPPPLMCPHDFASQHVFESDGNLNRGLGGFHCEVPCGTPAQLTKSLVGFENSGETWTFEKNAFNKAVENANIKILWCRLSDPIYPTLKAGCTSYSLAATRTLAAHLGMCQSRFSLSASAAVSEPLF